jgi:predicted anti-sigma-YlaC factor YlaD
MSLFSNLIGRLHGRCDHAMNLASRQLDGPLPLVSRARVWFHLATCRACAQATRQLRLVRQHAADTEPAGDRLDESAKARIRSKIRQNENPD